MEAAVRKKLEELAVERLEATADDEEQWSFCFRTEGAADFVYCPWSVTKDLEFDGETDGLDLPWSAERLDLITRGEAEPTEKELHEWRRAKCREFATSTDDCWIAWIVPLWIKKKIAGYALFVSDSAADPDEAPVLEGVFDSHDEARVALANAGAVADKV